MNLSMNKFPPLLEIPHDRWIHPTCEAAVRCNVCGAKSSLFLEGEGSNHVSTQGSKEIFRRRHIEAWLELRRLEPLTETNQYRIRSPFPRSTCWPHRL